MDERLIEQMTSIEMEISNCEYDIKIGEEAKARLPELLKKQDEIFKEMMK